MNFVMKEYRFKIGLNEEQAKYLLMITGSNREERIVLCTHCDKVYGVVCDERIIGAFLKKFPRVKCYEVKQEV